MKVQMKWKVQNIHTGAADFAEGEKLKRESNILKKHENEESESSNEMKSSEYSCGCIRGVQQSDSI